MRERLLVCVVSIVVIGAGGAALAGEHKWVGVAKCSNSCHEEEDIGNQTKVWKESAHAKAMETLASKKAKEWAADAGVADPTTDEKCVKCHQSAYGVSPDLLTKSFDPSLGVQCESCHGAGKDYRKEEIMTDIDVAVSKGLVRQSAEVCTACHNDESPAWDPERYTLADGKKVGFDYDQAVKEIAHPVPEGFDPSADDEDDLWGDEEEDE